MNCQKTTQSRQEHTVSPEDLEAIHRFSRRPLTQEEVYTFSVRLCDNEVDRDWERFPQKTLEQLAPLFVGKSGLFDHQWSSQGQTARIYRTEVVHEPERTTKAGDGYCWLKGYAYLLRTTGNEELIAQIEGGIKKEVSVGCAVRHGVCSICGSEGDGACGHQKGQMYDQKLCYVSLEEATDAYEFSFVAVPAQPNAGVVKGFQPQEQDLHQLVKGHPLCKAALERLEQEARLGRTYLDALRSEVVRLGGLSDPNLDVAVLRSITQKLEQPELEALKETYAKRAAARYPLEVQLDYGLSQGEAQCDSAFII